MTQTTSAMRRTMPRAWVMNSMLMPSRATRQQCQDLRLHRDVEGGGRLIGDQQIGLVGERHRDHDTLALAAGQLMRIAPEPGFRRGNAHLGEQFEGPRPRLRSAD